MWETKGNLENTTIFKLVWCAIQCKPLKKKSFDYEIILVQWFGTETFHHKQCTLTLSQAFHSKLLHIWRCISKRLHLHSLPQVPRFVRLEFETNLSWHLHMNTNPLLVVNYIWEKFPNVNDEHQFFSKPLTFVCWIL
jgi:hypothetical protein